MKGHWVAHRILCQMKTMSQITLQDNRKLSLLDKVLPSPPAGISKEENNSSYREWEPLELRIEGEYMNIKPLVESDGTKHFHYDKAIRGKYLASYFSPLLKSN